jgi:hypothetical protein
MDVWGAVFFDKKEKIMKNKLMMVLGAVIMIIGLGLLIENLQPKAEIQTAVSTSVLKVEKEEIVKGAPVKVVPETATVTETETTTEVHGRVKATFQR